MGCSTRCEAQKPTLKALNKLPTDPLIVNMNVDWPLYTEAASHKAQCAGNVDKEVNSRTF
jgi:hypothetical protein